MTELIVPCRYNLYIDCEKQACEKCGWNPVVEKKRKESLENRKTEGVRECQHR